jgi:nucleoside-diphosphate-sugar epimerase
MIAEQYWRHFQIASVAIRPHVVFGPEREVGLTAGPSLACRAAALQENYAIGYTGRVGYDYVEDVARAFVRAATECPPGATVADLPGEIATTEEFRKAICVCVPGALSHITIAGLEIPANIPPNPKYITELFSDWQVTTLLEGVRKTIDYYLRRNESITDRR